MMKNLNEAVKIGKFEILDSLRAFAALSVCIYHFVCTTIGLFEKNLIWDFFSFGKYGVQTFFVISGFIIPYSMYIGRYRIQHFFKFFIKRLARLEPPYMVSLILAIGILLVRERLLGNSPDLQELSIERISLHFAYLIPFTNYEWINQVYWTLAIEFQYYLLIALLFIPLMSGKLFVRIIVYVSIIACGLIMNKDFLPYWLPVFLIGIVLFLYKVKKIDSIEYLIVSVLTLCFMLFFHPIGEIIFVIIPVILIIFKSESSFKLGEFFGKMSYSIYLIHPIIGATFINVLSHHVTSVLTKIVLVIGGLIVTLVSSYIMYYFVEKPSKKLSSKFKYFN